MANLLALVGRSTVAAPLDQLDQDGTQVRAEALCVQARAAVKDLHRVGPEQVPLFRATRLERLESGLAAALAELLDLAEECWEQDRLDGTSSGTLARCRRTVELLCVELEDELRAAPACAAVA